jgi:hypothetical protein
MRHQQLIRRGGQGIGSLVLTTGYELEFLDLRTAESRADRGVYDAVVAVAG